MHSKISVNKNLYQCKSTDWFLYDTSFYRQEYSDCKIYLYNVKQRYFKPDFSLKLVFTNQYIAINWFSKKIRYLIYFQKNPSQVAEKILDLFPVPPCHFFFFLLVSLASFFRSTCFVLAMFLSVVSEEPVAHQKMIFSDYLFLFCFFFDSFLFSLLHHFIEFRIVFFVLIKGSSI